MIATASALKDFGGTGPIELLGTSTRPDVFVSGFASPLVDALIRINELRALGDNWDSYGGVPPADQLLDFIEWLVAAASETLGSFFPVPHVNAASDGGVQLEWSNGDRELELEFGPMHDGESPVEYLRSSHGEEIVEGPVETSQALVEHLFWIACG